MFSKTLTSIKKQFTWTASLVLLLSQMVVPFVGVSAAYAGANDLSVSDHEGQQAPSGTYTNGQVSTYAEGDSINFRYTVTAADAASGQMEVEFTEDDGNCTFFDGTFSLGTHDSSSPAVMTTSGATPVVTLSGTPTVVSGEWVQLVDVSFAAAGEAVVNYYLTLSDEASDCNGASQSAELDNSANTGDFSNIGTQNVPVPAKDVTEAAVPIEDLRLTSQCTLPNGARWFIQNTNSVAVDVEWMFSGGGASGSFTVPAAGDGATLPWAPERGANYLFFDTPQSGTLIVKWLDETNTEQQTVKATNPAPCPEPEPETAEVIAHKVVCDLESQLPNAGNGALRTIGADTAQNWVDQNDGCEIVDDWEFEYKTSDNRSNPGDETVGSAGGDWTTFSSSTEVEVENVSLLQLREVLPSEDYLPFGGNDSYSAEFYCHTDAKNYDNWEWIRNPQADATYYCVGFNTLKPATLGATKIECTSEAYLPNWGDGTSGPSQITETTADDWLAQGDNAEHCQKVDWEFQWAPDGTSNPGDELGDAGGDWTTFTDSVEVPASDRVWVREVFQEGYVEFAGKTKTDSPDGSAEIYCHTDIVNYDNFDFVRPADPGAEYHCVAWNALDDATVTVEKRVTNNNGGTAEATDFQLFWSNGEVRSAVTHNQPFNVSAGETVIVGEAPYTGYEEVLVTCGDVTDPQNPIRLNSREFVAEPGREYRCVIVNDDIAPKLTVNKEVENNWNGGLGSGDFDLFVDDQEVVSGVTVELNAGTYTVSELEVMGYSLVGITGDCAVDGTITLEVGGTYTCNITNEDQPAKVTVRKKVVNDDGGTATVADFALLLNGNRVNHDAENMVNGNTEYTVSERPLVRGYEQTDISCFDISGPNGRVNVGHPFEAENGREYVCQVTNDDVAPKLALRKVVVNDNGGNNSATEWTLTAEGRDTTYIDETGTASRVNTAVTARYDVRANDPIVLSESGPRGYDASRWDCDGGERLRGALVLAPGQNVTCTITNDDRPVTVTVVKVARNDNGGRVEAADFDLYMNGRSLETKFVRSGSLNPTDTYARYVVEGLDSNTTYAITEDTVRGYELESIRCFVERRNADPQPVPRNYQPNEGERILCRVFNNDIPATVTLSKVVRNNDGGRATQDMWVLRADGPTTVQGRDNTRNPNTGVTEQVNAGWYYLSELGTNRVTQDGYELTAIRCNDRWVNLDNPRIRVGLGQEITCTFFNDDIPPTLRLTKRAVSINEDIDQTFALFARQGDNRFGSPYAVDVDPDTTIPRTVVINGERQDLDAGWVRIGERVPENWRLMDIQCFPTERQPGRLTTNQAADEEYVQQRVDGTWVRLRPGDDVTCRFVNVEEAKVTVTKYWDVDQNGSFDEGESTLPDWTFELQRCDLPLNTGSSLTDRVQPVPQPQPEPVRNCVVSVLDNDVSADRHNGPARYQEGTTGEDGSVMFPGLAPLGVYTLSEQFQEGWNISGITCEYPNELTRGEIITPNLYYILTLPGAEIDCYVGNYQDGVLEIAKTNDKVGVELVDGDTVTYQITVTNPENSGIVYETLVYDLMPANIVYASGSGSASSTVRGALASPLDGLDYVADGPATWEIGDLQPGEVVTLTYSAIVANDTEPGTYDNIAFTEGWSCSYETFIFDDIVTVPNTAQTAFSFNTLDTQVSTLVDDDHGEDDHEHENPCPFGENYKYSVESTEAVRSQQAVNGFATLVSVVGNIQTGSPFVESAVTVVEEVEPQGFVLGVTTQELANTGSAAILPPAVGLVVAGAALALTQTNNRNRSRLLARLGQASKHFVLALALVVGMSGSAVAATDAGWQLNVVDLPDATASGDIDIAYQVASIDGDDTFEVSLWQDGVQIDMQSVATAFGDNGFFAVTGLADGTYEFTVLADNSDDPADKTDTQTVVVDSSAPAPVEYEGVEQDGNVFTLTFTVPAGSDATVVNVYSSTNSEFTADLDTLVGTTPATPGTEQTFTYTAANDDARFFAVEIVDAAGNPSTLVGDSETVVTGGGATSPAVIASGTAAEGAEVLGEDVAQADTTEESTADTSDDSDSSDEDDGGSSRGWIAFGLLAAVVLGYIARQRMGSNK